MSTDRKMTFDELVPEIIKLRAENNILRESLRDCASKLESQVCRNPDLPQHYKDILRTAFSILNNEEVK